MLLNVKKYISYFEVERKKVVVPERELLEQMWIFTVRKLVQNFKDCQKM